MESKCIPAYGLTVRPGQLQIWQRVAQAFMKMRKFDIAALQGDEQLPRKKQSNTISSIV